MKDNILIWSGQEFIHYCLANSLQKNFECNLFAIVDNIDNSIKKFYNNQEVVKFSKLWFFYDHVTTNFKKPDLDYLKKIEKNFHINIWEIAYSERFFYRDFNPYHKFTDDEILFIIQQECQLYEKILDERNYDFFLTNMITRHPKYLLYKMCLAKNIHPLSLETARFGRKFTISKEIARIDNSQYYKNPNRKKSNEKLDLMNYLKKYERGTGSVFGTTYSVPKSKKISALFKFLVGQTKSENYLNYGKTRSKLLLHGSRFIGSRRRHSRESFLDKNTLRKVDKNCPFLYFPLHAEPERELLIQAPYHSNQIAVISNVAKSIPVEYLLYVKEHPAMIDVNWRPIEYYKQILELPNVRLIHPSISSHELIKQCSLAITISGDVGLEAAFYGKPTIVFSNTDYSVLPFIHYVDRLEQLPFIIRKALSETVNQQDLHDYIEFTEENSFNFDEKKYLLDFNNLFYYAGFQEEQELTMEKMEDFLNNYSQIFDELASEHIKKIKQVKGEKS